MFPTLNALKMHAVVHEPPPETKTMTPSVAVISRATLIARRVRRLTLALTFATAALAAPAGVALAGTDPGVRCAAKVGPGQYEFYLPGERAVDVNGNKWVCGPDGQWFRDYSSLQQPPTPTKLFLHRSVYTVVAATATR